MMRASVTVSSNLPGTMARNLRLRSSRTSGSANTIARITSTPVVTSNALMASLPSRHAEGLPAVVSVPVNVGTNAALIAPSAKRSRSRLGRRNATEIGVHHVSGAEQRREQLFADQAEDPARHGGDTGCRRGAASVPVVRVPVTPGTETSPRP